jgi:predicted ribosome quality control (RQC) complex YloA/Tae2 family protein
MAKEEKTQVLSKEEIKNLTSLQKQQNDLIYRLGQVEYQLTYFTKQKTLIQQQLEALESNQTTTAQEIEKKYGQGTVNLESGEFIKA